MKVTALFSVENDYNQPPRNLICLWKNKPHFMDLMAHFDFLPEPGFIGDLVRGKEVRFKNTDYRLEEVEVFENDKKS